MYIRLTIAAASLILTGCQPHPVATSQTSTTPINKISPTTSVGNQEITSPALNEENICSDLGDLKSLPYGPEVVSDDPIYEKLRSHREIAIPCLIKKITDTTKMEDPSASPSVDDYVVGDAAVFCLLLITGTEWQPDSMFPPRVAQRWKSDGIFVYVDYVKSKANRRKFQQWWEKWEAARLNPGLSGPELFGTER